MRKTLNQVGIYMLWSVAGAIVGLLLAGREINYRLALVYTVAALLLLLLGRQHA